jgi:hypothetical protein
MLPFLSDLGLYVTVHGYVHCNVGCLYEKLRYTDPNPEIFREWFRINSFLSTRLTKSTEIDIRSHEKKTAKGQYTKANIKN